MSKLNTDTKRKEEFERIVFETMADMKEVDSQKWEFDWSKLWNWTDQALQQAYQKGQSDQWKKDFEIMVLKNK